jgi:hypothetical protein
MLHKRNSRLFVKAFAHCKLTFRTETKKATRIYRILKILIKF